MKTGPGARNGRQRGEWAQMTAEAVVWALDMNYFFFFFVRFLLQLTTFSYRYKHYLQMQGWEWAAMQKTGPNDG